MITCYEFDKFIPKSPVEKRAYESLVDHFGEGKVPYYSLIRGGVQFNQFVGVLQVGPTTIEVLPKIDRSKRDDNQWRAILIDMLRKVKGLDLKVTENAALRTKPNSILDLYMELFLQALSYLMHQGLVKAYRKTEGNRNALKGKLLFAENIRKNLVHAERFYVQHSIYDPENKFNRILLKALNLVGRLSTHVGTRAAVAQIRLNFPDLPDLAVNDALFERLPWSRKTEGYRKAIDIARLLLLNYHPDIRGGKEDVVALMFDMNKLWERYIIQILRRSAPHGWTVEDRENRLFWRGEAEKKAHLKPDIVLLHPESDKIVLDTKWKVVDGRPSDHDLRQLFAYQHHWIAPQGYLVYPDTQLHVAKGRFQNSQYALHVMGVDVLLSNAVLNPHLGLQIWEKLLDLPPAK